MKFIGARLWKFKLPIAGAALAAVVLTFALYEPKPIQAWTGKATVTIGIAPPAAFVLQLSGPPLAPLEPPRSLVARISDQAFREKVANRAALDPKTSSFSKMMVASSLRGIVLDSERDIAVELSAGSSADVQAALAALAAEISEAHGALLKQRLQPLRAQIEDAKARVAQIEKSNDSVNARLLSPEPADNIRAPIVPTVPAAIPAWNQLKDRIQTGENLAEMSEPTVVQLSAAISPMASRSIGTLRASILAGLVMIAAMSILALAVGPRRGSGA
ncbi:hypothetical protein ACVWZ4_004779 [Bradyrhizobium sp. USDA 4472]